MKALRTVPVPVTDDGLHIVDYDRRTFMALSRDGTYWHLVYPAAPWEWIVREGRRQAGDLICTCEGGRTHGTCYQVKCVEAFEADCSDEARWAAAWEGAPEPVAVSA